ncbi:hypothetical protein [Variovorax sp. PBL-E5]|uniref:hypothetical protein n=1 Tax=Variovorax sp. PBL-E5 TaxID=434014 RepID=UPI001316A89A|nr:hypothetical protein [Variovorax sp. PBL-E5]VTU29986.1 hypothetical protein E5CHR_02922 [Variovorax sp. PBL-E5]
MDPVTKVDLKQFARYCLDKGLMNRNTGLASITAVDKLLDGRGDLDDISELDIAVEAVQFNNRNPGRMSPGSLMTYQQRVSKLVTEYVRYRDNPAGYKVQGRGSSNGSARKMAVKAKAQGEAPSTQVAFASSPPPPPPMQQMATLATEHALALPFPLRPSFLAQVVIPRDLTKEEANRLCAFIQALGHTAPAEVPQ